MYIRIGSYSHRIAEANLRIGRDPVENATGAIIAYIERWNISGRLHNRTGSAKGMDPIIRRFEQAYSINGQDIALLHIDGTPSYHQLLSRDAIGGNRIASPPQFSEGRQGEMVSYRSYSVAVEAMRPVFGNQSLFVDFQETIDVKGGGAKFGCSEVNYGPGVRQRLRTHSTCTATQTGSATYWLGWPTAPKPIWPFALVDQYPDVSIDSPERISTGRGESELINGSANWSYNYSFPRRLFGIPHYLK